MRDEGNAQGSNLGTAAVHEISVLKIFNGLKNVAEAG